MLTIVACVGFNLKLKVLKINVVTGKAAANVPTLTLRFNILG